MKRLWSLVIGLLLALPLLAADLNDILGKKPSRAGQFLEVDEAFQLSAEVVGDKIVARWTLADGYYLYQHRFGFSADGARLGKPLFPAGKPYHDENFGDVTIYTTFVEVPVPITAAQGDFTVQIDYQGCADKGLCYPPTSKTVALSATVLANAQSDVATAAVSAEPKALPQTEENRLSRLIADASLPVIAGVFLLAGLALTFTPCVFPMLPIITSLVAGQHGHTRSTSRNFWLVFAYVQGMAVSFALLGVAAALAGRGLAGVFQSPWMVSLVALLFIGLALSMFGLYELRLPSALTTRATELSNRQQDGSLLGAALMGVLGTLVVSPCVTPPLTAAMLYIAQTGDKLLGALSLYMLAVGMGLPLLIIGTLGGKLLPRAGAWMDTVKAGFGVMMLGLALYLVSRFLPGPLVLALWAALFIFSAVALGAFINTHPLRQGLAIVLLVTGLLQALGAAMGNTNPLLPLQDLRIGTAQAARLDPYAHFRKVKTVEALATLVAEAKAAGRPVMVDFYAEWCVACHEFAAQTFPDPAVKSWMDQALLVQVDVTANDAEDKRILKHHAVLGLPTLLFYNRDGVELSEARVTGFMKPEPFARHLAALFATP